MIGCLLGCVIDWLLAWNCGWLIGYLAVFDLLLAWLWFDWFLTFCVVNCLLVDKMLILLMVSWWCTILQSHFVYYKFFLMSDFTTIKYLCILHLLLLYLSFLYLFQKIIPEIGFGFGENYEIFLRQLEKVMTEFTEKVQKIR